MTHTDAHISWRLFMLSLLGTLTACAPSHEPERQPPLQHPAQVARSVQANQAAEAFKHVAQDMQLASSYQMVALRPESTDLNDERITARIDHDLRMDSELSRFEIDVETLDGVVTLSGILPNTASRSRAETLSKLSQGVKAVNNLLDVVPTTQAAPEIAAELESSS